jgi:hypothetical protein
MDTAKYVHEFRSDFSCDTCVAPIELATRTRGTPKEPLALLSFCGAECAQKADEQMSVEA